MADNPPFTAKRKRSHEESHEEDSKINHGITSSLDTSAHSTSTASSIPKSIFLSHFPQPDLTLQITDFLYSLIESPSIKTQIENLKKKDYVLGVEIEVRYLDLFYRIDDLDLVSQSVISLFMAALLLCTNAYAASFSI